MTIFNQCRRLKGVVHYIRHDGQRAGNLTTLRRNTGFRRHPVITEIPLHVINYGYCIRAVGMMVSFLCFAIPVYIVIGNGCFLVV